jgi:hypothetical protein
MGRGTRRLGRMAGTLSLLALAVASRPALAVEVYRTEDGEGTITYTNLPPAPAGVSLLAPPPPPPPEPEPPPTAEPGRAVGPHGAVIRAAALRHGVDERLVHAIVRVESAGNPRAVSPKGALGLMQLMPGLAARLDVRDPFDPAQNVSAGVRHLQYLLARYAGRLDLALAAYNAGEEAVRVARGIPPYPETRQYVQAVLQHYGRPATAMVLAGNGSAERSPAAPAADPPAVAPLPPPPSPEVFYEYLLRDGTILLTNIPRHDGE